MPAQVLAKTILLSSTTRFRYSHYKSGGDAAAVVMRIRLYSPSLNKQANIIWVSEDSLLGWLPDPTELLRRGSPPANLSLHATA